MEVLFVSTPVGALGSGLGGGVELTLLNLAREMQRRGHGVEIVAPTGSIVPGFSLVEIPGSLQPTAQTQHRTDSIVLPAESVLGAMWDHARQTQAQFDLLVNFAYDWLPFYLTPFFQTPIAHLVSMGSLTDAMDGAIDRVSLAFPGTIGVHSRAQAATFPFADQWEVLENGFDLSQYEFRPNPGPALAWVGRIAPEKGLEDGVAAAQATGIPLWIFGVVQDEAYWQRIQGDYPQAPVVYQGFLPTAELQQKLGQCRGLLMTPRWVEAFGNVAIEALACGVPVIAYERGGPAEIVEQGKTGWLVPPDNVEALVAAIARLGEIDRHTCRQQAEATYSLSAMGERVEAWFQRILQRSRRTA